jgi:hypothetical protein
LIVSTPHLTPILTKHSPTRCSSPPHGRDGGRRTSDPRSWNRRPAIADE